MRERRMRRGRARGGGAAAQSRPIPAPPPGPAGRGGSDCAARRCRRREGGEVRRSEVREGRRDVRGSRPSVLLAGPDRNRPHESAAGRARPSAGSRGCRGAALSSLCSHQALPLSQPRAAGSGRSLRPRGWAPYSYPSRRLPVPSGVPGSVEGGAVRSPGAVPWGGPGPGSARRGQESSPCSTRSPQCGHLKRGLLKRRNAVCV